MKNKDWVGNTNSVYKIIGASNHAIDANRDIHDFYATSASVLDSLKAKFDIPKNIVEPMAGDGHLSKKLIEMGHNVISYDIIERNYPLDKVVDFFQVKEIPKGYSILTNPAYKIAKETVLHALKLVEDGQFVIMFLKTTFLEGKARYNELFSKHPPKYVYVFVERQICAKGGDFENVKSSAVSYSFFVWEKGWNGNTTIEWI